ncbi:class I SAM-dependent methyltransferase [Actinoallomurus purpureus]|uniref:class I SAM-dependent methyltransferase n=1 Tax=Actinoallomurus purpureus TaxID=478114 RepID=UPI00209298C2|nr:class I SAM-dependent methyltransferase [Actinoallomurus purpureus]MCO6006730.1 class I SAM-dependent methyltransferase [Actinoallomurus purpureus]
MTELRTPPTYDGDLFHERVREYADERPFERLRVLDAGCGRNAPLDLDAADCHVTGVDVDLPDVRAGVRVRRDLDAWHLGDLRTVPMPPRVYDVVHAPYLIERIPHAELVLDRFVAALRPGGLMLVRFRDRDSAFGRLDRVAPRWLRAILWQRATPPQAVYERVTSLAGMRAYCLMRGLVITEEHTSAETVTRSGPLARMLCRAVSTLSQNRLTSSYSEVSMVIRKPENRYARII